MSHGKSARPPSTVTTVTSAAPDALLSTAVSCLESEMRSDFNFVTDTERRRKCNAEGFGYDMLIWCANNLRPTLPLGRRLKRRRPRPPRFRLKLSWFSPCRYAHTMIDEASSRMHIVYPLWRINIMSSLWRWWWSPPSGFSAYAWDMHYQSPHPQWLHLQHAGPPTKQGDEKKVVVSNKKSQFLLRQNR